MANYSLFSSEKQRSCLLLPDGFIGRSCCCSPWSRLVAGWNCCRCRPSLLDGAAVAAVFLA
ncbi:hypothetical protein KY284_000627 [Solanum tuberosum]|nr:hypothetical protein KY284_000627 [Solanum tuberosum]